MLHGVDFPSVVTSAHGTCSTIVFSRSPSSVSTSRRCSARGAQRAKCSSVPKGRWRAPSTAATTSGTRTMSMLRVTTPPSSKRCTPWRSSARSHSSTSVSGAASARRCSRLPAKSPVIMRRWNSESIWASAGNRAAAS